VPTVIVGRFRNTSSEHIDTNIISGIMRTAIINNGKLEFVEGGDTREDLRAERSDQLANASEESASALGNETAANFMLTGEVSSTVEKAGGTTVRAYFVKATLTNVETNRILWEGSNNEIKKVFTQAKAKF
ncbi:MAG: penicillin-binding protein activator LpoB, partial [Treponema sp.]|jgi:PBP1b-binding outer membrane lipoprotein LpoB|nr:penicillin-binding protein activator LpoB [Treponema sp.]